MNNRFLFGIFFGCIAFFKSQDIKMHTENLAFAEGKKTVKMTNYNVNPNTLNYDLKYERLELTLDPAVYNVSGSATLHFLSNQNLNSIYFDLTNVLAVSEVLYHGNNLSFSQLSTKELKIDFTSMLPANTLDSLTVKYAGAPDNAHSAFSTKIQNGTPVLSTLSQPYGAQDWFPTKQSMTDKIDRFDMKIITPSQYSVASNGKYMSETDLGNGTKLSFWRTQYPMAAYLVALGITNYTKFYDTIGPAGNTFPFINYLYPSTASNSTTMANIAWTAQSMNLFEEHFGPYPFRNEKYGHMEFSSVGNCMEHQTMSSMSSWGQYIIAHELAHQWFGNKITCGTWNDIWLNEGFATFGEHLTYEKILMTYSQFMNYLLNQKNYITSVSNGSVYVSDANLGNEGIIFSARLSYSKGAYILRMIKWILGDDAFYQALRAYNSNPNYAYGYTKSTDFANSLQNSTGKDFTEFFNDWLYGQGQPSYTIKWNQANGNIIFNVSQTQSDASVGFFEMPLPIKVTDSNGEITYFVLNNTSNNQSFEFPYTNTASNVQFNYEYQILENNSTVTYDSTLNTNEIQKSEIKLFPNPVKDILNISGLKPAQNFEIYSEEGRLLKKGTMTNSIKISELTKGNYILKINNKSFKFIKE